MTEKQIIRKVLKFSRAELSKAQGYYDGYLKKGRTDDLLNAQAHGLSALELLRGYYRWKPDVPHASELVRQHEAVRGLLVKIKGVVECTLQDKRCHRGVSGRMPVERIRVVPSMIVDGVRIRPRYDYVLQHKVTGLYWGGGRFHSPELVNLERAIAISGDWLLGRVALWQPWFLATRI